MRWTIPALAATLAASPAAADYLAPGDRQLPCRRAYRDAVRIAGAATWCSPPGAPSTPGSTRTASSRSSRCTFNTSSSRSRGPKLPILLWHGGGLTGVTWKKEAGRQAPGWQHFFLQNGYDTYVSDAVERGRASWARFPEIFKTEPLFRTKKEAWELFRIGPTYEPGGQLVAYEGQQFPVEAFDQFMKQAVPRWTSTDAAIQRAYDAYVDKVCPCIVVVHSQGSNLGFPAALNAPDKIKALVAVEPSGSPDPAKVDLAKLKGVPHLHLMGRLHRPKRGLAGLPARRRRATARRSSRRA